MSKPGAPGTSCPDALEMASYLSGTVSSETKARLEGHFADCARCCQELAALMRLEFDSGATMDEAAEASVWRRIQAGLRQSVEPAGARRARVVILRPAATPPPQVRTYALAAATEATELEEMPTYLSEDGSVVGRFLRDEAEGQLSLFLITEHMPQLSDATVVVDSPQIGFRFEGAPDPDGVVALGVTPILDPDDVRIELRFSSDRLPPRPDL